MGANARICFFLWSGDFSVVVCPSTRPEYHACRVRFLFNRLFSRSDIQPTVEEEPDLEARQLLTVDGLKTYYATNRGELKAVDGISFSVKEGQILGLVGESGCGKTTVALSIMKLLPSTGRIMGGKVTLDDDEILSKPETEMRHIRWRKISMIFQGALNSLNPVLPIREQIAEALMAHTRTTKQEAEEHIRQLLLSVGLEPSRMHSYPHELSGGMKQRVMIAMALSCHPKFVIADEPSTALDVVVQHQILDLMRALSQRELSMMLITHDLSVVAELCDTIAIMYAGKVVETGDVYEVFENPKHPYTKALLDAIPKMNTQRNDLRSIPGVVPDLTGKVPACRFRNRCPYGKETCECVEPFAEVVSKDHQVACHFWRQIELQ